MAEESALSGLLARSNIVLRRDSLAACLLSRSADSTVGSARAVVAVPFFDRIDYTRLFVAVRSPAVPTATRDDLISVLSTMQDWHCDLELDKYDSIRIFRSGTYWFEVYRSTKSRRTGYVVALEMNDYESRIRMALETEEPDSSPWFLLAAVGTAFVAAVVLANKVVQLTV